MTEWRPWLPELITGGATITISVIGRMLGVRPIARIKAIKRGVFAIGAREIDLESCLAENRALREALARSRAMEEMKDHELSDAWRSGSSITRGAALKPTVKRRRPIRSLSQRSATKKPATSPTDPTPT